MTYRRLVFWTLVGLLVLTLLLKFSPAAPGVVWSVSGGGSWLFPLVTVSALLDSINPCAFSVLLITVAFLMTLGAARRRILLIGGFYILGIFVAYFSIGLGIIGMLHLFNTPHFMGKIGALALLIFGLLQLISSLVPGFHLKLQLPVSIKGPMSKLMYNATLPAAFGLGALVGLCEFPCTGGPYLAVLGMLHDTKTYVQGLLYLVWYNFVFTLPLIAALWASSSPKLLEKLRVWRQHNVRRAHIITGISMVVLGIILFVY